MINRMMIAATVLLLANASVAAQQFKDISEQNGLPSGTVLVDTTGYPAYDSMTYDQRSERLYTKVGIVLRFDQGYDPDSNRSIIDTLMLSDSMDAHTPELLYLRDTLVATYGSYRLGVVYRDTIADESEWVLDLDSLTHVYTFLDSVNSHTNMIGFTSLIPSDPLSIPNDRAMRAGLPVREIVLANPGWFGEPRHYHRRGFLWSIYSVNLPLAWEITTGDDDIVMYISDEFNQSVDPITGLPNQHPDFKVRNTIGASGNLRVSPNTNTDNGTLGGVRVSSSAVLGQGHGVGVSSNSFAAGNDDTPLNSGRMMGSCMSCNGIVNATWGGSWDIVPLLDVDLQQDGNRTMAHAANRSFVQRNRWNGLEWENEIIGNGIVMVHAAGNGISGVGGGPGPTTDGVNSGGATTFQDPVAPNDPWMDLKAISVGAIQDGDPRDTLTCTLNPITAGQRDLPEGFARAYNYSGGLNKFSTDATIVTLNRTPTVSITVPQRILDKENAWIDLVAPGIDVMIAINGTGVYDPSKYLLHVDGTSQAAPVVQGAVGLMRSVDLYLGTFLINGVPQSARDVHRRAYNILTFTATKLADDGLTSNASIAPAQPNYVVQTNDRLQRSWAQRMGFGKLNAYRAVAHSIRLKGDYEYTASQTLTMSPTSVSPEGFSLMHWGSKVREGVDVPITRNLNAVNDGLLEVLTWGGTSMPGESHNNQGVTRINAAASGLANRIDITVPSNSTLAIDGILVTDQNTTSDNRVIAVATGSRILIEGRLENIELVGRLRIGDLTVTGTATAPSLWMNRDSEIYGTVRLLSDAHFFVADANGPTVLQTGSTVSMEGTKDLVVWYQGELQMQSASRIVSSASQIVDVQGQSTLRVKDGARCEIDAPVRVRAGSTFIIEDTAIVYIRALQVDEGGRFIVRQGAHVIFGEGTVVMNGMMEANGINTVTGRIVFSSEIDQNCEYDMRNHSHISTRSRIVATGTSVRPLILPVQSSVWVSNADFKNVSLEMHNISKQPFLNCNFSSDRTSPTDMPGNVWSVQPNMLVASNTIASGISLPDYENLAVVNCRFVDSAGTVIIASPVPPISSYNPPANRFSIGGVSCVGHSSVSITGASLFHWLAVGADIRGTNNIHIEGNTFRDSDVGVFNVQGAATICSNSLDSVEVGLERQTAGYGRMFDNTFTRSRNAVLISTSSTQAFRNNIFTEYHQAISISNSTACLAPLSVTPFSQVENYGRNHFAVSDPMLSIPPTPPTPPAPDPMIPSSHPNPFMRRSYLAYMQDLASHSDLWAIDPPGGVFQIACGYNGFSVFAPNHIGKAVPPAQNVNGINNDFRPFALPRSLNHVVTNPPWNLAMYNMPECATQPYQETCEPVGFIWTISLPFPKSGRGNSGNHNLGPGSEIADKATTYKYHLSRGSDADLSAELMALGVPLQSEDQRIEAYGISGQLLFTASTIGDLEPQFRDGTYFVVVKSGALVVAVVTLLVTP